MNLRRLLRRFSRARRLRTAKERLSRRMDDHVAGNRWDMSDAEHDAYMRRGERLMAHARRLRALSAS